MCNNCDNNYPFKIDGRKVRLIHGQDSGRTGTLLYFHNGNDMFDRWVARIRIDDDPIHRQTSGLNYNITDFEVLDKA